MRVFVGLDVSLAKTAVCVADRDGGLQWQGKIASEPGPLIKRLEVWAGEIELVGIEARPLSDRSVAGFAKQTCPSCASRPARRNASCRRGR